MERNNEMDRVVGEDVVVVVTSPCAWYSGERSTDTIRFSSREVRATKPRNR